MFEKVKRALQNLSDEGKRGGRRGARHCKENGAGDLGSKENARPRGSGENMRDRGIDEDPSEFDAFSPRWGGGE